MTSKGQACKGRSWLGVKQPSGAASDLPSGEGAMADHSVAAGLAVSVPCPRAGEWKILFKGKTHNVN